MPQIEREGTYRGHATEVAVNTTKNGFPQLVLKFVADEWYGEADDASEASWVPWAEYEADIIGYFVLFGAKGKCLNFEQVQKAFPNWSGASFADLDQLDVTDSKLQLRVEWEEYEGKENLKAVWIDAADAVPGSAGLQKLDSTALKTLDAKFAGQMGGKKTTPKKAPKGKPTLPPTRTPKVEKPEAIIEEPKAETAAPVEAPPTSAKKPARGKKKAKGSGLAASCTREEAWSKVCELKMASVTDDQLSAAWVEIADKVAGEDTDPADITTEQWATIRDEVLTVIPSIPF